MPSLEQRLQNARDNKEHYTPNPEILKILGERVTAICVVVGPTGVGKSTLIDKVCEYDDDFFLLGTVTTREGRKSDPDNYQTDVSTEHLLDLIEKGEVLQYDITNDGQIYASTLESIKDGVMIVPVLSTGVSQFLELVEDVIVTGIIASGNEYKEYLSDRKDDSRYKKRLEEALISLNYLSARAEDTPIIENSFGKQDEMATRIIRIIKENRHYRGNTQRIKRKIDEMIAIVEDELEKLS